MKCCDKCYSTYTTDDWPAKETLDACINGSCECHTPKESGWRERFKKELCSTLPDGTAIVGMHDTGEDREAEYDFWQDYKVEGFIEREIATAIAATEARFLERFNQYQNGWLGKEEDGSDRAAEYDVLEDARAALFSSKT